MRVTSKPLCYNPQLLITFTPFESRYHVAIHHLALCVHLFVIYQYRLFHIPPKITYTLSQPSILTRSHV